MSDDDLRLMRDAAAARGKTGTAGMLDTAISMREVARCAKVLANYTVPQAPAQEN